jgi:hypothetical protein
VEVEVLGLCLCLSVDLRSCILTGHPACVCHEVDGYGFEIVFWPSGCILSMTTEDYHVRAV